MIVKKEDKNGRLSDGRNAVERIAKDMTQLIGNTPLLELGRFCAAENIEARLLAKLEAKNPGGSAKDRAALGMIRDAEARGLLRPGSVIIEPTSGNTGISLAAIAAVLGYRVILTMPETMSLERRKLIRAYGAEIVLTEGSRGMPGAIARAHALAEELDGSFLPGQFDNPANAEAHFASTGPEIWADTDGRLDAFVCCVGSGGTMTGVGAYLKRQNPSIRLAAVEPAASPVLSGGAPGAHGIQGIGAGFVPAVLDTSLYAEVIPVTEGAAKAACRTLATREGILAGISSGAALAAAVSLAKRPEFSGKTVVVLLPDTGERYLSTDLFPQET
jgi:cysteine synthase A